MKKLVYLTDKELDNLPRVTSSSVKKGRKFHPDGLFSEQIFGPVESFRCQCSNVTASNNQVCPVCGVRITSSSMRRRQFAVIDVNRIINPVVMEMLLFLSPKIKKLINSFLNFKKALLITENKSKLISIDPKSLDITSNIEENSKILYGLDAIFEITNNLVSENKVNNKSYILQKIKQFIIDNQFFTKYVVVIPPDLRPVIIKNNTIHMDEINKLYLSILVTQNHQDLTAGIFKYFYECKIQQLANQLSEYVFSALSGKEGLIRGKMSGKRIDFSGRSVITVNPNIPLSHIGVPRLILLQLWKLELASYLIKEGKFITYKSALDYLQQMYESYKIDPIIEMLIDKVAEDQFIIFNRQPSLHRSSMFSAKVKPTPNLSIELNPLHCQPLNADFDGDSIYGNILLDVVDNETKKTYTITTNITKLHNTLIEVENV